MHSKKPKKVSSWIWISPQAILSNISIHESEALIDHAAYFYTIAFKNHGVNPHLEVVLTTYHDHQKNYLSFLSSSYYKPHVMLDAA